METWNIKERRINDNYACKKYKILTIHNLSLYIKIYVLKHL